MGATSPPDVRGRWVRAKVRRNLRSHRLCPQQTGSHVLGTKSIGGKVVRVRRCLPASSARTWQVEREGVAGCTDSTLSEQLLSLPLQLQVPPVSCHCRVTCCWSAFSLGKSVLFDVKMRNSKPFHIYNSIRILDALTNHIVELPL